MVGHTISRRIHMLSLKGNKRQNQRIGTNGFTLGIAVLQAFLHIGADRFGDQYKNSLCSFAIVVQLYIHMAGDYLRCQRQNCLLLLAEWLSLLLLLMKALQACHGMLASKASSLSSPYKS